MTQSSDFESGGKRFESFRARHSFRCFSASELSIGRLCTSSRPPRRSSGVAQRPRTKESPSTGRPEGPEAGRQIARLSPGDPRLRCRCILNRARHADAWPRTSVPMTGSLGAWWPAWRHTAGRDHLVCIPRIGRRRRRGLGGAEEAAERKHVTVFRRTRLANSTSRCVVRQPLCRASCCAAAVLTLCSRRSVVNAAMPIWPAPRRERASRPRAGDAL